MPLPNRLRRLNQSAQPIANATLPEAHLLRCRLAARLVARRFEVALAEIGAPTRRSRQTARARQAAMYLAHVALGVPFASVGEGFGRDRSTAAYACRRIEDKRDDPAFDAALDVLETAARIAVARAEEERVA
jgi:chromosomal replication initiation ATPase DnaA